MNFFEDRKIKKIARDEDIKAPDKYLKSVERTLNDLKNNEEKIKPIWSNIRKFNYAIAMAMLMFVLLTNVSPKFAYAMQELPIIGDIVKVITIRNYFDKDGNSEIEMEIPNIKNDNNSQSQTNENVNEDVNQLTQKILDKFYAEENSENHLSIKVKSDVIENNKYWFTLKLTISEVAASSDLKYKYYNIDKRTDEIVKLSDLFDDENYKKAISEEIKKQMVSRMEKDKDVVYWIDEENEEWSFSMIEDNQNFYFSNKGNIVIAFDKYEVGPGATGAPEFEINKQIYEKYLK